MENDNAIEISADELARLTSEIGLTSPMAGAGDAPVASGVGSDVPSPPPPPSPAPAAVPPVTPGQMYAAPQNTTVKPAAFMPLQATDTVAPDLGASKNIDLLLDINMKVSVELGRTRMAVRDVLGLSNGSVLELDRQAGEPVDILINDRLVARGEVVVIDDRFGVRVTDIETPSQRVRSLR